MINWDFFDSLKEGREAFNEKNWTGWVSDWTPIASNSMGDAIIIYNDAVYEVQHGTGKSPVPTLLASDIAALESLFVELKKYKGFSDKESIEDLRKKIELLSQLRKSAPRALKYDFTIEIDDLKDTISDLRYDNSKEGKFFKVATEIQKSALTELRKKERYSEIRLLRRENKFVFYIAGKLKKGESLEEIKSVFSKYSFLYPIEYDLDKK